MKLEEMLSLSKNDIKKLIDEDARFRMIFYKAFIEKIADESDDMAALVGVFLQTLTGKSQTEIDKIVDEEIMSPLVKLIMKQVYPLLCHRCLVLSECPGGKKYMETQGKNDSTEFTFGVKVQ